MTENAQNPFDAGKLPKPSPQRQREVIRELEQVVRDANDEAQKLQAAGNERHAALVALIATETAAAIEKISAELGPDPDGLNTKAPEMSVPKDTAIPRLKK